MPAGLGTIAPDTFANCSGLLQITIPASVTEIGHRAFDHCIKLASVTLPQNLRTIGDNAFYYCSALTKITLPASLAKIGRGAFSASKLTEITFPVSLNELGNGAFSSCPLLKATFLGNAPPLPVDPAMFGEGTLSSFRVYYYEGRTGFTSPLWARYKTVQLAQPATATAWLSLHGFAANTDPNSDPDRDGVDLFTAYALNLDPHRSARAQFPRPEIVGNDLQLNYYAGRSDASYLVQVSSNLKTWTTTGIITGSPDANQFRIARIPRSGKALFMRLQCSDADCRLAKRQPLDCARHVAAFG